MSAGLDGFLLVDKPAGVTSFDVVDHVRGALMAAHPRPRPPRRRPGGPRPPRFKCGHTGTLDPRATGLLVVLTGRASRLAPFLGGWDKTYAATVRFGSATDTLDAAGAVTATAPAPDDPDAVRRALDAFRGDIMQAPPRVSALKRGGRALHARVRAGEDVAEPDPRPVRIAHLEATAWRWPGPDGIHEVDLEVRCSAGTYVRSLARDLARAVGSEGHLAALRRLAVGPFRVEDALDGVMAADGAGLAAALRPAADALPDAPAVALDETQTRAVRTGQPPAWDLLPAGDDATVRLLDPDGRLVAVARREAGVPRLAAVLAGPPDREEDDACA